MAEGRFISYLRVSTAKQGLNGLGVEGQRAAVMSFLNGGQWSLLAEFVEVESGKNNDRPELAKALHQCRLTGATLVIAKLDRLSRDACFLLGLEKAGVDFVAADMPHANRMTIGIMAVVADEERRMISKRTKDALAVAKARGTKLGGWKGGPIVDHAMGRRALVKSADGFAGRVAPTIRALQAEGLSLRQIAGRLTADRISTARDAARKARGKPAQGGTWTATAVANVLARLAPK